MVIYYTECVYLWPYTHLFFLPNFPDLALHLFWRLEYGYKYVFNSGFQSRAGYDGARMVHHKHYDGYKYLPDRLKFGKELNGQEICLVWFWFQQL